MQAIDQPTRADTLAREIERRAKILVDEYGVDLKYAVQEITKATLQAEAQKVAADLVRVETAPDFAAHLKTGGQLLDIEADDTAPLVDQMVTAYSTNGIIAPTNSGGSSFQVHLAASFLTGEPVLGAYPTKPDEYRVLWLNPEEDEVTPAQRLSRHGVPRDVLDDRFLQAWTRDGRFYFNRPHHVEAMLHDLGGLDWVDDPRPLIVFADGLQPTLSGTAWNEDLEAWKEGVGTFRLATHPAAIFVRAQVTSSTSRRSKRGEESDGRSADIDGEDVSGGQFFQWPDHRLILNRRKGGERHLEVRGRRFNIELTYSYDPKTGRMEVVGMAQNLWARVEVSRFLGSGLWRAELGDAPSYRAIARYLNSRDPSKASESTYRRAAEEWKLDQATGRWRPREGR